MTVAAAEATSKAKVGVAPKGTKREKKGADDDNHDIPECVHPLLESIERRGDEIWVLGATKFAIGHEITLIVKMKNDHE